MKKKFITVSVLLLSICIYSCNSGGDKEISDADSVNRRALNESLTAPGEVDPCEGIDGIDICKNAGGIGNFVLNVDSALAMIDRFSKVYKKDNQQRNIKALDSVYWLDRCIVFAIENFLKTEKNPNGSLKYDGIRIYMSCEINADPVSFPNQQYQRKTSVFIFPTMRRDNPPAGKSEHQDDRVQIRTAGCQPSPFLQPNNIADPKITKFDEAYRRSSATMGSLSTAIWIDSCVVFTLAKILRLPNANLDGANINMAAYGELDIARRPSQGFQMQSTTVIAPTNLVNGIHVNNWKIIDCLFRHSSKELPDGGFNHGELCPKICN
jgi:hypothetical protein